MKSTGKKLKGLLKGLVLLSVFALASSATAQTGPTLASSTFYGGAGDEQGTSVAIASGKLYLAGYKGTGSELEGIVAQYTLPPGSSPVWNATWPGLANFDKFSGIGVSSEGVYVDGDSYGRTTDSVGGKEIKGIVVKFPLTGATGAGYGGSTWDKQTPAPPGVFSYGGGERLMAITVAEESAQTFAYATGAAQSGWWNCGRLYLSKLGAEGTIIWTVNDGSEQVGNGYSYGSAITTLNGNIYVAGQNDNSGSATCGSTSSKPYMRKYDRNGNLLWSRMSSLNGAYSGIASFGGTIYAVGTTPWGPTTSTYNFLIEKWDESGNLTWSKQYDRNSAEDILYSVVGIGAKIYAVGSTQGNTSGGKDAVILEIDPVTGELISSTLWGGALDDVARGVATDGTDLYVVGESRSFASAAGNAVGQNDMMILRYTITPPDNTPPTTTDNAPSTWQKADFTVALACTDNEGGSGCKETKYRIDGGAWQTGSSVSISTDGDHLIEYYSIDNAGNQEGVKSVHAKLDKTPPTVTITAPTTGSEYILNGNVLANWSATDAVSGIASATGTVPSGSAIDTSTVGEKTFTVVATDNAGNQTTQTETYYVRYVFDGFLQPINSDGSSLFKLGSTVPVKFQLQDANGNFVSTAIANIYLVKMTDSVPAGSEMEAVSTSAATTGSLFRYDGASNQYIFNLWTKTLSKGYWRIRILLDDGTSKYVFISLR